MSGFIVLAIIIGVIVILQWRKASVRSRQTRGLAEQIGRTIGAARSGGDPQAMSGLPASIAEAVQQALSDNGLAPGSVTVSTQIETSGTPDDRAEPARTQWAVGDVLSVSSLSGMRVATVELDAIGAPKWRATVDVADTVELARGDRIYVIPDPADPSRASLPPAASGPFKLPEGANRLDAIVLGPMILSAGAEGNATVQSAEQVALANPALAASGASKWRLALVVSPRSGFPFRADLTITLTNADKVDRICHRGAEVPVRYDPQDPRTIAIDSPAMGYGNPYDALGTMAVAGSPFAGKSKIEQIAALRAQTGMGLKAAKEMVERIEAGEAAAPFVTSTTTTLDWNSLAGLGKIARIDAVRRQAGLGLKDAKDLVEAMERGGSDRTAEMLAMLSGKRRN